jgi:hypothetical protein
MPLKEVLSRMKAKAKEPLYVSFDNKFLTSRGDSPPGNTIIDVMYKLSFPIFISSVIWQKIARNVGNPPIVINENIGLTQVEEIGGGSFPRTDTNVVIKKNFSGYS